MTWFRVLLLPFALLYGLVVWLRNLLFDSGLLPSSRYPVPVISVGNLSMGGAGKTPLVEYLVRLLGEQYTIAVLSRGYKRKTRSFVLAGPDASAKDIGDEPLQIYKKFPGIYVAVHEKRRKGINILLKEHPDIDLIILDDAFQHRYVDPGLNLLLTGYYSPFFKNFLLPVGNLRETKHNAKRADALIVTKTPTVFSPLDRRYFMQKLCRYKVKHTFFSGLEYQPLVPLTGETPKPPPENIKTVFLLTGIARSESLEESLKERYQELIVHKYRDHHQFTANNLKKLRNHYHRTISHCKVVITTEKDAMRLPEPMLREHLPGIPVYYLPIAVVFKDKDKEKFARMVFRFLAQYTKQPGPS